MNRRTTFGIAMIISLTVSCIAMAAEGGQADEIRQSLMRQFDRPEERLNVDAIVATGDIAVASWAQGDMGGRALLRHRKGGWAIVLCSGDALKSAAGLEAVGVPKAEAATLARFDGVVVMEDGAVPSSTGPQDHSKP